MIDPNLKQGSFKLKMHLLSPEDAHRNTQIEDTPENKPFLEAAPLELDFGQVYLGQIC